MINMIYKDEIKSVAFPKTLLKEIDEFREKNFFKQFSPAILYLVHLGLQYHQNMQQNNRPLIFQGGQPNYMYPIYTYTGTITSPAVQDDNIHVTWYTGNINYGTAADTGQIYYGK